MEILLKPVDQKNWQFIYNLRTNESSKNNFYSQKQFSLSDHYSYLSKQEKNPNFFHWIIVSDSKNVGYVRILDNDISIMIESHYENKGIGSHALKLVEDEAKKLGLKKLVGRVLTHNTSSKKIFEKNNYKLKMYWLEKDI